MTYQELIDLVTDEAVDLDPQFFTHIDLLMQRAQLRIEQDLDLDATRASNTLTLSGPTVATPAELVLLRSIRRENGQALIYRDHTFLFDYWPDDSETGTPKYYTWVDDATLRIVPPPAVAEDLQVQYIRRLPVLSVSTTTNWISENIPNLLQQALLVEAVLWSKDAELVPVYNERYATTLAQVSLEQNLRRRTDEYTGGEPRFQRQGRRGANT